MKRILLDTHIFLWWAQDPSKLRQSATETLGAENVDLYLSIASAWEIAIKESLGKLIFNADLASSLETGKITLLPIDLRHTNHLRALPELHRDPFDRMLVAQG